MTTVTPERRTPPIRESSASTPTARSMWRVRSVRLRIVLGYTVLLLITLVAATLITRSTLFSRLEREILLWQEHQAEEFLKDAASLDPSTGEPFQNSVRSLFDEFLTNHVPSADQAFYTFVGSEPYRASLDAPMAVMSDPGVIALWTDGGEHDHGEIQTSDGSVVYLAVPVTDTDTDTDADSAGMFVVATYPDADRAEILTVVRVLAAVGVVLLAASLLLALSLARRVLRPVRQLTDTALRIEESDLSARIPVAGDDELAELSRTFNSMLDRLEDSFHSQRDFLDDVAHELRTPITIVRGHLELLENDPVERRQTVTLVTDELDRMARSVDELLIVAKSGRPDFLHLSLVDVHDLIDGVLARASALGVREWRIGTSPRPAQVLMVADPERLTQALLALASNAVDHSPVGSPITFSGELDDGDVVLSVTDRGTGVDPAIRDHLFTRFARSASSEAGRPDGMGLGLTIVASIADAHGGRVDVRSTVGEGATFRLVIPHRDPTEDSSA